MEYARPPITEAIFEIRMNNIADQDQLKKIASRLERDHYPNKKDNIGFDFNINMHPVNKNVLFESNQKQIGYRLTSDDQTDIVIIGSNNLLLSRLAPYPGWDAFYDRFISVWKTWKRIIPLQNINRIGVRYNNRIDIPLNGSIQLDIKDYLNIHINDPFNKIPMDSFVLEITKPTPNSLWLTNIASTIQQPPVLINTFSLLLDIDVFTTQQLPLNDNALYTKLREGRELKNYIFKKCITSKTEELFA